MNLTCSSQQSELIGQILSGCRVTDIIGVGGMGTVYRARDENLQRDVAIKIMHAAGENPRARERFMREASAIAQVDHSGLVRIFSFGEHCRQPYFIMELVEGISLDTYLVRCRMIHGGEHSLEDLQLSGYVNFDRQVPCFLSDHEISPLKDPDFMRVFPNWPRS